MKKIMIADVTLRESAGKKGVALSFKERLEAARLLDKLGADIIEAAPIADEKTDTLVLRTLCPLLKTSILSCPTGLTEAGVKKAYESVSAAKKPRLLVSAPVSAVQMEYLSHKKPPKMLEAIKETVSLASSLCGDVEFEAQDATRSEKAFLFDAVRTALEAGAKTVTLCDTSGTMLPDEFSSLIAELYAAVPELKSAVLGVECSDKLQMANACAFACVEAGAAQIKTSIGSDCSPSTEAFANALSVKGEAIGACCSLNTMAVSRSVPQIMRMLNNDGKPSPYDSVPSASRSAAILLDKDAEISEVSKAVVELGYDLCEDDLMKVYESFRRVAGKKQVGARELDSIVANEANQVPPTFKVESYVINSGSIITSTANIVLSKNGRELSAVATGDGPIDAAFQTIEQIIGHHYELDDFQIQSVTEGREALGEALIKLRSSGKLCSGRGISTDIIGASIHAYINALNKIVYEENNI